MHPLPYWLWSSAICVVWKLIVLRGWIPRYDRIPLPLRAPFNNFSPKMNFSRHSRPLCFQPTLGLKQQEGKKSKANALSHHIPVTPASVQAVKLPPSTSNFEIPVTQPFFWHGVTWSFLTGHTWKKQQLLLSQFHTLTATSESGNPTQGQALVLGCVF